MAGPQDWWTNKTIGMTFEMKDAARQAGFEGKENEWAHAVLIIEAEKIVCSHRRKVAALEHCPGYGGITMSDGICVNCGEKEKDH